MVLMTTQTLEVDKTTIAIINKYQLSDEEKRKALSDKFVKTVVDLCKQIQNKNPYMQSYINELETSFTLYGYQGLKSQIAYILCNFRARTPNDKEIKKILQKL